MPCHANKPEKVEKYLNRSLQDLGLDYVDMYLIHMPFAIIEGENFSPIEESGFIGVSDNDIDHIALWKVVL